MVNKMPLLSVIMPVYNEEQTLLQIIKRVKNSPIKNLEIIAIDDKSTDGSRKILEKLLQKKIIDQLILKEQNEGKGSAINLALKKVTGEIVIIQDADLEYDPQEYDKLLAPIIEGRADVVYGSRFISPQAHRVVYFWHYVANVILTLWSDMFTNLNLTDMETGYKAFRRSAIAGLEIEEKAFGIEPEITAKIARRNLRIYEVGISYAGRTYEEGKKIGLKDAFRAFWAVVKYNVRREVCPKF